MAIDSQCSRCGKETTHIEHATNDGVPVLICKVCDCCKLPEKTLEISPGISRRDFFAGCAMLGQILSPTFEGTHQKLAAVSKCNAEALILELDKTEGW